MQQEFIHNNNLENSKHLFPDKGYVKKKGKQLLFNKKIILLKNRILLAKIYFLSAIFIHINFKIREERCFLLCN